MGSFKVIKKVVKETTYVATVEAESKQEVDDMLKRNDASIAWKVSGESNTVRDSVRKCKDTKAEL